MAMITPSTLGAQLRAANQVRNLEGDVARFQEASVTGRKTDLASEGPGVLATLTDLRARFSRIEADRQSIDLFQSRADLKQQAMQSLDAPLTQVVTIAATGLDDLNETVRASLQNAARGALDEVVAALNVSDGSRFLFSGVAGDRSPLQDFATVNPATGFSPKDVIDAAILANPPVDAASATTFLASLDDIFNDVGPAGQNFEETFYNGAPSGSPRVEARLADDVTVSMGMDANDGAVRDIIKGLAVFASFDPAGLAPDAYRTIMQGAFDSLTSGLDDLRVAQSQLGNDQRLAANISTRNDALSGLINERVVTLESADPFETQIRLQGLIGQLETAFTLTSRIANLSLINFLR
ncbi:hypothetical protein GCM10007972_23700 [Iodidimonas muriae]|uniref:Flagellin n=1 Tax=Iodidimonas muriae TaxID=261467 RepID=A0ABQ2LFG1_9PROT|nr:flagellin [Iodidimonas muriae]GER08590.1 hypothetical protein JCM17843_29000 [Kordiimonadales bacterium JCM 17843]GGO15527.1 hypothetical protein GCM10007972_23700 [Iodidimonas muriae]